MSDLQSASIRVHVDATSAEVEALRGFQPFAVAHAVTPAGRANDALFVVRGAFAVGAETTVSTADCLPLAKDVDPTRAILALPLATVLALWESVALELGEVAIWTAGSPLSNLAGQAAIWRGACPGIELGPGAGSTGEAFAEREHVDWSDSEMAMQRLTTTIAAHPGFAAVDLSGRAEVIDTLLEVIPTFGRLVLAGPPGDMVTLDFYKNIHRKGIVIRAVQLEPALAFDPQAGASVRAELPRALEILRNAAMAERCRTLVGSAVAMPAAIAG